MPDNIIQLEAGLDPLAYFYARSGGVPPALIPVVRAEMPEPYKSLLDHENDMTPTLEAHHEQSMYLYVIDHERDDKACARMVVLIGSEDDKPAEFGAICINLECLPVPVADAVVLGHKPLGGLLAFFDVEHRSSPKAYCKVQADATIKKVLKLDPEQDYELYGRKNQLWMPDGTKLAEVVEILPL
ncbi:MAG: chorismate-pyruvate lyase [Kiritimatiellia bacterium]|jgi:chorismate-pyruvate lyase